MLARLPSGGRSATPLVALVLAACGAELLPDPGPPPAPARMAEGVSRADSLAIIEELGGWPPPQSGPTTAASAPAVRCRPYPTLA